MSTLFVLGATDPEMEAIEGLLRDRGETFVHATMAGKRVNPGTAYRSNSLAESQRDEIEVPPAVDVVVLVECDAPLVVKGPRTGMCDGYCAGQNHSHPWVGTVIRVDHHRPGDPGFGRPPSEFLAASSIGQVVKMLDLEWRFADAACPGDGFYATAGSSGFGDFWTSDVSPTHRLVAAADHCLGSAYRGECPGVDPVALARWRAESRAKFQGVPVAQITAAVDAAKDALQSRAGLLGPGREIDLALCCDQFSDEHDPSYRYDCGCCGKKWAYVVDMRGPVVPELPEAACQLGVGYIAGPLASPDGRQKITCSGSESQVRAFIEDWGPSQKLVDIYGDPARGFAGGYLP